MILMKQNQNRPHVMFHKFEVQLETQESKKKMVERKFQKECKEMKILFQRTKIDVEQLEL